ncbi:MAG TPA: hypothetical protein VKS79_19365 [Gemmataceae bacterium]|nr:hypothetical protein [Gemmataceae bacterium]
MDHAARLNLIQDLRERSRQLEASPGRGQALEAAAPAPQLLRQLLRGEIERGTLVEWLNESAGSGGVMLALAVAAFVLQRGGVLVLIDGPGEFYPPGLAGLGVPLERTVIVRPGDTLSALWAWEQALRCKAVAVTLGRLERLNDRLFHRFQLAAETGGGLGFLLRPAARAGPSKAALRLRVAARPCQEPLSLVRRLQVEVLYRRGGAAGAAAELELGHDTNPVRLLSELADPAPAARATGA